jgi:hypothetical protein
MAVQTLSHHHATKKLADCVHCRTPIEFPGRFCGECGAPQSKQRPQAQTQQLPKPDSFIKAFQRTGTVHHPDSPQTTFDPESPARSVAPNVHPTTPNFARPNGTRRDISPELKGEISNVLCGLAREKVFLVFHWCVFLGMNFLGLFLAFTAYNQYIGDELTKCVMGFTPIFFINSIALACLAPIKGTKREIERLREKLKYLKYQVEYQTLI